MVTDLWCHHAYNLRGAWHTVYAMLLSNYCEMLSEIHTMEKFDFLNSIIFLKLFNSVLYWLVLMQRLTGVVPVCFPMLLIDLELFGGAVHQKFIRQHTCTTNGK